MTLNPEFRRNLILELTPYRLIAMPVVLGLIFGTAWAIDGPSAASLAGEYAMLALLVLWGGRGAADAVFGEVSERTWDAQRMSSIGPWSMAWGKLFGTTAYSWYGALFCVPAILVGPEDPINTLIDFVLFGLLAQGIALFVSLLLLRIRPKRTGFLVNVAHAAGILAAFAAGKIGSLLLEPYQGAGGVPEPEYSWYGVLLSSADILLMTRAVFVVWTVIGVYRLMRLELQFKPQPLVWLSFVLFVSAYVGGLSLEGGMGRAVVPSLLLASRLSFGLLFIGFMSYCAVFLAPSGAVDLRRLVWHLRGARFYSAFQATPPWIVAAAVAILQTATVCILVAVGSDELVSSFGFGSPIAYGGAPLIVTVAVAFLLFYLRDLGLIQFVILSPRARRGHLAALVYLAILYGALPILLTNTGLNQLLPAFVPYRVDSPALLIPVVVQIVLIGAALVWRWRQISALGAPELTASEAMPNQ